MAVAKSTKPSQASAAKPGPPAVLGPLDDLTKAVLEALRAFRDEVRNTAALTEPAKQAIERFREISCDLATRADQFTCDDEPQEG